MSDLYAIEAALDAEDPKRAIALFREFGNINDQRATILRKRLYQRFKGSKPKLCRALIGDAYDYYKKTRDKAQAFIKKEMNTTGTVPPAVLHKLMDVLGVAIASSKKFMEVFDGLVHIDEFTPNAADQAQRHEATVTLVEFQKELGRWSAIDSDTAYQA